MNLKVLNVVAMALIGLAVVERRKQGSRGAFLLAACLLDAFVLWTLLANRHAATIASHMAMTPIRLTHVFASALFPIFYPFLLLGGGDDPDSDRPVRIGLLVFAGLRGVSFLTSYFMTR